VWNEANLEVFWSGCPVTAAARWWRRSRPGHHSNVASAWGRLRREGQDWPDDSQWAQLREADRLEELHPATVVTADSDGRATVEFALPMPGMSLLTLTR
jgi:hypothetical protein